jgi:hypothetical protein
MEFEFEMAAGDATDNRLSTRPVYAPDIKRVAPPGAAEHRAHVPHVHPIAQVATPVPMIQREQGSQQINFHIDAARLRMETSLDKNRLQSSPRVHVLLEPLRAGLTSAVSSKNVMPPSRV